MIQDELQKVYKGILIHEVGVTVVDFSRLPFFTDEKGDPAFIVVVGEDSPSRDIVYASMVAQKVCIPTREFIDVRIVDIVKLDEEVREEDKKQYNMILIGKSHNNALIREILQSGIKPHLEVGKEDTEGESHYLFFKDPWGYGKSVLIIANYIIRGATPPE